jgi:hypothetical protein
MEVQLDISWALDRGERSASYTGQFTPTGKTPEQVDRLEGELLGQSDSVEKRQRFCPCQELGLVISPYSVTILTELPKRK